MARSSLAGLIEALGAVLVVLGLIFWSLPMALVATGAFLLAVANAPGGVPAKADNLPGRDAHRATSR